MLNFERRIAMKITNAQYHTDILGTNFIKATIDGVEMFVPIAPGNRHYQEIMQQVEAGDLVIAEAE
jgi:hypothetical protein